MMAKRTGIVPKSPPMLEKTTAATSVMAAARAPMGTKTSVEE